MRSLLKIGLLFSILLFVVPANAQSRDELHHFTIQINGKRYIRSARISPKAPIKALFMHPLSKVSHVRMQHPDNPNMAFVYPVDQEVRLTNHEGHMKAKHDSASDFIAIDSLGKEYGSIRLTFKP